MDELTLQQIIGDVISVIFQNEENGYTVLRLDVGSEPVTLVGCIPFVNPGEKVVAEGAWENHPTHGPQFKASYVHRELPDTSERIYQYLSSGVITGLGSKTATALVNAFGRETLQVLAEQPERLKEVGINSKRAQHFSDLFRRQNGVRILLEFLTDHGIRPEFGLRLYQFYEDKALELIQQNPYILVSEKIGADFSDVDNMAYEIGFADDCPERVSAAVLFELQYNLKNGHTFLPKDKLIAATAQIIQVNGEVVEECIGELLDEEEIIEQQVLNVKAIYLHRMYVAETYTAQRLLEMVDSKVQPEVDMEKLVMWLKCKDGMQYSLGQLNAIRFAANRQVSAITGGPGTGKTTVLKAILMVFDELKLETVLAAPTGRAAKRMAEVTGREAQTIHRLLQATKSGEDFTETVFRKNAKDPLRCDAVIVDECSMIDIALAASLLEALPDKCRLILVGDADQLPSVGPGAFFGDILRSNVVPVACLKEVFRQSGESRIVQNAHEINKGNLPNLKENKGDFFFMQRGEANSLLATITDLCANRLPKGLGIPSEDIQVISPTRIGDCGTVALNNMLQAALNPAKEDKPEKKFGAVTFRVGDRVMQVRNNYDMLWTRGETEEGAGVFNGDVGRILAMDKEAQLFVIQFDDRICPYPFEQLSDLDLAYAVTVHKSQGSEYRAVILSAGNAPTPLLRRDLLYTAVTRAKECLVAVGEAGIVKQMVDNGHRDKRYSGLRARLNKEVTL